MAVNAYIKVKGLSGKIKNDLINSVMLQNGYGTVPWDTKVGRKLWVFGYTWKRTICPFAINTQKEWLPDHSRKITNRYFYDGTLVPNGGHNTGEFVDPI